MRSRTVTLSCCVLLVRCVMKVKGDDLLDSQGGNAIYLVAPISVLLFSKEPVVRKLDDVSLYHVQKLFSLPSTWHIVYAETASTVLSGCAAPALH